ncbi:hypothetical protein PCASD_20169 [Puccinia coronata f. sp. avenae]|uniref:Uncharacterized protein n=1 Tax=Puccinia coronata f. sp. avenae TaxID=200324 RepID=A0A2N5SCM4_9BASI|nr:hypothetical protein PCASD_20169 [Puccinia coronata f. sp. avenae]
MGVAAKSLRLRCLRVSLPIAGAIVDVVGGSLGGRSTLPDPGVQPHVLRPAGPPLLRPLRGPRSSLRCAPPRTFQTSLQTRYQSAEQLRRASPTDSLERDPTPRFGESHQKSGTSGPDTRLAKPLQGRPNSPQLASKLTKASRTEDPEGTRVPAGRSP